MLTFQPMFSKNVHRRVCPVVLPPQGPETQKSKKSLAISLVFPFFFFLNLSAKNSDLSYFYILFLATRRNNYSSEGSKLYHVDNYCDISLYDRGVEERMDLNREEKGSDADYSC